MMAFIQVPCTLMSLKFIHSFTASVLLMPVDFFLVICLDYVLSHDIVFTEFWVQCQIFLNLDLHKPR